MRCRRTSAGRAPEGKILMSLNAVLKVGGSLSHGENLASLCQKISSLGRRYSLLVVPGGGQFADQVREAYRRYNLSETAAHRMALLAMDQYGYLLNQLIPGSSFTTNLLSARQVVESGQVAVLLPSELVIQADPLPHSWKVTSDTIAAWVAHTAGCQRLILLKDVDGLLGAKSAEHPRSTLIAELSVKKLAERTGGVDEYFASFLATVNLETWVINGLRPERLTELLETTHTTGTRIAGGGVA